MRGNYRELSIGGQQAAVWLGLLQVLSVPDVRFGSRGDITACPCDVRFTPDSGHSWAPLARPFSAMNRHRTDVVVD